MNKKLLGALMALAMTTSAMGLATACGEKDAPVTLENFVDVSAEVELGSLYSLASPVAYDTEGNDYKVTYTATTASGANVTISNNQISIDKFETYKILCSVTIDENDVRTRTLTLNVKDKGKPTVKIGDTRLGYVGKEYVFPEVTVSDASGETITPTFKLFRIDGETETEVQTTDGKFTPTERGVYRLDIAAKDSSGNETETSTQFAIRNELAEFVFEDFDDEYGKSTYTNKLNETTDEDEIWYEEFEGKKGVVSAKSTTNQYGPHQYFKFNMTTEELAAIDFEYIYVDLYVHYDTTKGSQTKCQLYTRNTPIGSSFDFDTWVRIKITPEMISDPNSFFSDPAVCGADETPRECFNRVMTTGNGHVLFYMYDESSERDAYTFYVGEIGYKGNYKAELGLNEEYNLGEYITLNGTVAGLEDYTLTYEVVSPSGETVAPDAENKFRLIETGEYTVKTVINHETQGGESTFTFNVKTNEKFEIADFTGTAKQGEEVTVPVATFGNQTVTTTVRIGNHTETLVNNKFVPALYGEYTIEYSATMDGLVYRDYRTITVEKNVKANEVHSFSGADSVNDIVMHNGSLLKAEWLAEYEGETGVVKLTDANTEWPAFSFFPVQQMSAYADYDYLIFRIFMPADVQTYNEFCLLNGAGAQYRSPEKGKWVDVQFDIGTFKEHWKDNRDEMDLVLARVFSGQTTKDEVVIYIGDIYAVKSTDKMNITVTPECAGGELLNGGEITLNVANPDNVNYALTLTGPDGNAVTLENGKFTGVTGTYTYKITAEGFVGEVTGTFEVKAGARKEFTYTKYETTVKQGAEIALPTATYEGATANIDSVKVDGLTLAVNDGKVSASVYGEYTVEYIVIKDGMTFMDSITITVEKDMKANEVNSFDGADSLSGLIANGGTTTTEWLTEYEGRTGVAKITYNNTEWPSFVFFPVQQMSAYADYDYLVFRVYLSETYPSFNLYNGDGVQYRSPEKGKWVEVQFNIGTFLQHWKDNHDEMELGKTIICTDAPASKDSEIVLYIDGIYAVKNANKMNITVTPECAGGELLNGGEITLNVANPENTNYVLTLFAPDGSEVTLENGKFTGVTGVYTYKITAEGFVGENTGSFEVKAGARKEFAYTNYEATVKQGAEITLPTATYEGVTANIDSVKVNGQTLVVNGGKVATRVYGEYTVEYVAVKDGMTFMDSITITVEKTVKANEVNSFDGADSVNDVTIVSNADVKKVEWLAEYQGETGVVKISETGSAWPAFVFYATQQMSAYDDYDYLVFKIFMPTDVQTYNGFDFINSGEAQYRSPEKGKWVEVQFDIGTFKKYWKDNRAEMDLNIARVFSGETSRDEVTVYVSDIYVKKNASKCGVEVTPQGTLVTGNEVELVVTNPNNVNYTMHLYAPDGSEVTLENGKFTAAVGVYTYKITAEGFVGEATGSFEILPALALEISEAEGTYRKGEEVLCPNAVVLDNGTAADQADVTITVKYGNDLVDLNGKKFIAQYAGTYTLTYTATYGGATIEKSVTVDVMETDCLVEFDHEAKASVLFTETASTKEFISAEKVASDSTLPVVPEGSNGYLKVTGKANTWGTFAFGFRGNYFTKEMLAENDYIDVTLYFAGKSSIRGYWYNYRFFTVTPGQWTTVRMPISMFSQTDHGSRDYRTVESFYNAITAEKLFDMYDWSTTEDEFMYIASARLVKETPDETLGDRFVGFDKDNLNELVQVNNGTIAWDDTENGIRLQANAGSWANVYFKAGKHFSELHNYSKIRVICKNVDDSEGMFVQNKFRTDDIGNEYVYWNKVTAENGITYFELDMSVYLRYYYRTSDGADSSFSDNKRALLITNGEATDICILDIVLVK